MSETAGGCGDGGCVCGGKGPALSAMLRTAMQSEEAAGHFRRAGLELMMGIRELLDQRIKTMSPDTPSKGTKLNVE